jgi:hypothetical protein
MEKHFSPPRMLAYLLQFGQGEKMAAELYVWNTDISAAFWRDLAFVEVALRNCISRQLEIRYRKLGTNQPWIFDPIGELSIGNRKTMEHLNRAMSQVLFNGRAVSESQVISELPFGFWHLLLSKRFRYLWPEIAEGFLGLETRSPDRLSLLVSDLRTLRNRIGHHHAITKLDLEKNSTQMMELAHLIDPEFGTWVLSQSQVRRLLQYRTSQTTQE